jgi:hypothetical protein
MDIINMRHATTDIKLVSCAVRHSACATTGIEFYIDEVLTMKLVSVQWLYKTVKFR